MNQHQYHALNRFEKLCADRKNQYGEKWDPSDLSQQFVSHFNTGHSRRIKVKGVGNCGEDVWGFVGITTGWKPAFLLMRREGQVGSSIVLSDKDQILGQKNK